MFCLGWVPSSKCLAPSTLSDHSDHGIPASSHSHTHNTPATVICMSKKSNPHPIHNGCHLTKSPPQVPRELSITHPGWIILPLAITKTTAPRIPTWSPTVVLTKRYSAWLRRSDGMRYFLSPMAVDKSNTVMWVYVPCPRSGVCLKSDWMMACTIPSSTAKSPGSSSSWAEQYCGTCPQLMVCSDTAAFHLLSTCPSQPSTLKPLHEQVQKKLPRYLSSLRGPKTQICRTRA